MPWMWEARPHQGRLSDVASRATSRPCVGCGKLGHVKVVCWFGENNKHYKKGKKVNQMSAAKVTVVMTMW